MSIVLIGAQDELAIRRALASCLAQNYGRIEVLIVSPFGSELTTGTASERMVHWITTNSTSTAEKRNIGLRAAAGEFVHFLDSAHELKCDAVAKKIEGFEQIPDARLCFSHCEGTGLSFSAKEWQTPHDDPRSAVADPMLAAVTRFPIHSSTMMIPRWFLCQVGEFENEIDRWDDVRYAFRMARQGLKAIALSTPHTIRLENHVANHRNLVEESRSAIEADLRSAADLMESPKYYRYLVPLLSRVTWFLESAAQAGMNTAAIDHYRERIMDLEARIGRGIPSAEGLIALLFDQILLMLQNRSSKNDDSTEGPVDWSQRLAQLHERRAEAQSVTGADLRRWLPALPPRPFADLSHPEQVSLAFAFGQLQSSVLLGEMEIPVRTLVRVGRDYPGHPHETDWNGLARLAKVLGDENAKRMYRQRLVRYGWNWLENASKLFAKSQAA